MQYYDLHIGKITRKLPIVSLGPKIKVASFNLLGDVELVEELTQKLEEKLTGVNFDYLVGPEVKVVPLMQALSKKLKKDRYVVLRKEIHGYMTSPRKSKYVPPLVINGTDSKMISGKKVVLIDDVITSGRTLAAVEELMNTSGAKVVKRIAVFLQGERIDETKSNITFLYKLPVFTP